MLLLLLIGAGGEQPPIPPVDSQTYQGDTYYYDASTGTGSISDGTAQPAETIYD